MPQCGCLGLAAGLVDKIGGWVPQCGCLGLAAGLGGLAPIPQRPGPLSVRPPTHPFIQPPYLSGTPSTRRQRGIRRRVQGQMAWKVRPAPTCLRGPTPTCLRGPAPTCLRDREDRRAGQRPQCMQCRWPAVVAGKPAPFCVGQASTDMHAGPGVGPVLSFMCGLQGRELGQQLHMHVLSGGRPVHILVGHTCCSCSSPPACCYLPCPCPSPPLPCCLPCSWVAAKLLKRSDEIALGDFRTEIAILRKISHPNCTQVRGGRGGGAGDKEREV